MNKTILICGTVCVVAIVAGVTVHYTFRSPEAAVMEQCSAGLGWGKTNRQLACAEAIYGEPAN